jgi:hypothetical protein
MTLIQGWLIYIGLWGALGEITKNFDFLGHLLSKTEVKCPKYQIYFHKHGNLSFFFGIYSFY